MNMRVAALVLAAATLSAAACGPQSAGEGDLGEAPDRIVPIKGTDRHQVVLTADGATRLGIHTAPIGRSGIPVGAIIYDSEGRTWTYISPAALTYERAPITIGRVSGGVAKLISGPKTGTPVVTVGSAELYGAEYGVGGE
jgi:multidrug efflux pump subunit AcrA (membrane-fusion protein)